MSEHHDYGPLDEYEVTWRTGKIERISAHQVSWSGGASLFGNPFSNLPPSPERVRFHAEIDGHWKLILDALADDVMTVRNVTHSQDQA